MKEPKVVELFTKYEKQIRCLFEFYAKLEDVELNEHVELNTDNLQYRAFIKLSNQMKLVPTLVTNEEIVMIYKLIMKERAEAHKDNIRALTYEDFLEALVRITIRGNEKLGKIGPEEESKENESKSKENTKKSTSLFFDVKEIKLDTIEALFKYLRLNTSEKKISQVQRLLEIQKDYAKSSLILKQKKMQSSVKGKAISKKIY